MDIDSTPILNAILISGSIIFVPSSDPTHLRTFDSAYMLVKEGYLEIGTEDEPYTSKLEITIHGKKYDPELPIYGNKVLAIREGTLDMHGVPRTPTWSELSVTAEAGTTTITMIEAVDWQSGEEIIIAPTGFDNEEGERRTIVSVDNSVPENPVIILDSALLYKHYSGSETYGSETLTMRAEVGLLTRNVVFKGDSESS